MNISHSKLDFLIRIVGKTTKNLILIYDENQKKRYKMLKTLFMLFLLRKGFSEKQSQSLLDMQSSYYSIWVSRPYLIVCTDPNKPELRFCESRVSESIESDFQLYKLNMYLQSRFYLSTKFNPKFKFFAIEK